MSVHTSLTMIVKNEAANLPACLGSVQGIVDEIIVVDTGSTDNTRAIALQHGARVFDFPWCDNFAAARNEAIRHATGRWLFWLDADEQIDDLNRDRLRNLLANLPDDNAAYAMKCLCLPEQGGSQSAVVDHVRLFRNHPEIRWDYRVHEQILPALRRAGHAVRFADITIAHTGYQDPARRLPKLERNLRLLHLDHADRPSDPYTLFNLGWAYADLGRPADAIPLLQESLRHSHPADSITPKLYLLLAQCHRQLGQHDQAWAACQTGNVRCPADAELLFLKGQLCRERGDRAAARACWIQLLPANPFTPNPSPPSTGERGERSSSAFPLGGRADAALPEPDGTFTSVDAGLRGPLTRHHLAVLAAEEEQDADAECHWQAALTDSPDFRPARLGLAELYLHQARWPELDQLLAPLQDDTQAAVETAVLAARALLARKEFAAARQRLEETIQKSPQTLSPYLVLSHVYLQSGDETAAEPLLRRIVERDPTQSESWRNLAVLYRRQRRLSDALAAAQSGRVHCSHDADLLLLYAVLLRESGDWINAETCLLRVLETDSGDGPARSRRANARHNLALVYRALNRTGEAVAHWRALLTEDPDFAAARRALAECYLAQGRGKDAEPLLARLDADAPETALLRARILLDRREFAEAARLLEDALARHPRYLDARVVLSYVHLREERDPAAAERALLAVLELDPANAEARHNLQLLSSRHGLVSAAGNGYPGAG